MFNKHRARPARMEGLFPGVVPGLTPATDPTRGPVTFAWWAYTGGGHNSRYFHLETLYRLEREGAPGTDGPLKQSEYYGVPVEQLRGRVRARQDTLLPCLPDGYLWVGPQIVEDIAPRHCPASALQTTQLDLPRDRAARLSIARELAQAILRERGMA